MTAPKGFCLFLAFCFIFRPTATPRGSRLKRACRYVVFGRDYTCTDRSERVWKKPAVFFSSAFNPAKLSRQYFRISIVLTKFLNCFPYRELSAVVSSNAARPVHMDTVQAYHLKPNLNGRIKKQIRITN